MISRKMTMFGVAVLCMLLGVAFAAPAPGAFVCPSAYGYFADVTSCSNFWQCVNSKAYSKTCPDGLFFNPVSNVCDYSANVNCALSPTVTPPVHCIGGNDSSLHPDTANCYYFYQCQGFNFHHFSCPDGLQFNVATSLCDYPAQANCPFGGTPAVTYPSVAGFTCPDLSHAYYPDSLNCSAFWVCEDGYAHHLPCEHGLYFNSKTNDCDFPANVFCASAPVTVAPAVVCAGHNDTILIPDTTSCGYFYECVGLTAYRMSCPGGLYFSVATNRCEFPATANCPYGV